jgi:glycosyltransferase involved in cell wall biosynthesis
MGERAEHALRIGYIAGQARRINEQVIDDQWTRCLGRQAELVPIPPLAFFRLFGGSVSRWMRHLPDSLTELAAGLEQLCRSYGVKTIYVSTPMLIPYLLMARTAGRLDVGLLFIAHSVGSESWLRRWMSIAPFLMEQDVLLVSTESCRRALLNISPRFANAVMIPLCLERSEQRTRRERSFERPPRLLAIGRIEDVKNVDVLLECFADVQRRVPGAHLTVIGEYTGEDERRIATYRQRITGLIQELDLSGSLSMPGRVVEGVKQQCLSESDLLLNLSTDPGETFGYNLIEAKSHGVPAVCTRWDGLAEVVREGEDGLLVDCDWQGDVPILDRAQVTDACMRLLTDPALYRSMSAAAFSRANQYAEDAIMPRIAQAVLERRSGGADELPTGGLLPLQAAQTPIAELEPLYCLDLLRPSGLTERTPLELLTTEAKTNRSDWWGKCKPIIRHFAGRCEDA